MGFMEARAAQVEPAAPGAGKGVKVVILGAGIAGLVSAYELRALGYECTLLECRQRPGGRNWTVRGGDRVTFLDGTAQTCTWDEGNYQILAQAASHPFTKPCWATAKSWVSPSRWK
jgi:monoamine oxidase